MAHSFHGMGGAIAFALNRIIIIMVSGGGLIGSGRSCMKLMHMIDIPIMSVYSLKVYNHDHINLKLKN